MRALIQRVRNSKVTIDGKVAGEINRGMLIFLGVSKEDSSLDAANLADRCVNLRIFSDNNQKMNRSLLDENGEVLIVSQFTLYADCTSGRRPSFTQSAPNAVAEKLYEEFIDQIRAAGVKYVATGEFGADMLVEIENDGPVTMMLESKKKY